MHVRAGSLAAAVVTLLLIFSLAPFLSASQPFRSSSVSVKLYRDGSALVTEEYVLPNATTGEVELLLIAEPDPSIPPTVTDEEDLPLPFTLEGNVVRVLAVNTSILKAMYVTQDLTSKSGAVWSVKVLSPGKADILLPPEATIVYMSHVPELVDITDEGLYLSFKVSGEIEVQYALEVKVEVKAPPPANLTPSEAKAEVETKAEEQERPPSVKPTPYVPPLELKGGELLLYVAALLVVAILLLGLYMLVSKPKKIAGLRPEEEMILDLLRARGGEAYQYEIVRELGLPKTTAWRIVMRLKEKGFIDVEKRYGMNYLRLRRGGRWA